MIDLAYLPLVVEECGEVIQAAMKLQRFGRDHKYRTGSHKGRTNFEALGCEIGDLLEVLEQLGIPKGIIEEARQQKRVKLLMYGPHNWYPGIEDDISSEPTDNNGE